MERHVDVGNDNPTFPGRNFQRRTFYRGQPIDEKRNPLALYYFGGKEEEQRKYARFESIRNFRSHRDLLC